MMNRCCVNERAKWEVISAYPEGAALGGFTDSGVRPKPIYSWMLMSHGGSISIYISIYSISISSPMGDDI